MWKPPRKTAAGSIRIARNGEVMAYEGQLPRKEAQRRLKADKGEDTSAPKAEITKAMQNYLELHRRAAVRVSLLERGDIALRLAVAQIIAGSEHWNVTAEPQKAANEAIGQSVTGSKAEDRFHEARQKVRKLLGVDMAAFWSPDETFLSLMRDKEVINAMLGEVAGKSVAEGNLTATAKIQK